MQSWGIRWNQDIYHSLDYDCQCGHVKPLKTSSYSAVVGFDTSVPGRGPAIIIRCPTCSQLLWFHITLEAANSLRDICDVWPQNQN